MQIQPEIAFHNCEKVDWAEDQILDHIERLEEIYDRLITCRVRVDQRNDNTNHTIPPVVRIEISVPGHKDIVVAHEPDHLQRKFQAPDLKNAINEAFRIAGDRLVRYKEQLTDRTASGSHEAANEMLGQIAETHAGRRFRFSAHRVRQPALLPPQQPALRQLRPSRERRRGLLRGGSG